MMSGKLSVVWCYTKWAVYMYNRNAELTGSFIPVAQPGVKRNVGINTGATKVYSYRSKGVTYS